MADRAGNKIIADDWREFGRGIRISGVVDRNSGCEGIDVCRYHAEEGAALDLAADCGHILSVLKGTALLLLGNDGTKLHVSAGTHLYVPPAAAASLQFAEPSFVIHAAAPDDRALGARLLVHNERYLAATRFVLTPQYLSRRAFLHRDHTLVSTNGDRVAWFHTTMFDTLGLPGNSEGKPVFKMSYDHQSEVNVVYDVKDGAAVRFARHPYREPGQQSWSDWQALDGSTTYHLNEASDGPEIERHADPQTGRERVLRNRHEIYIAPGGHVSLCCMFDPGPTGLETHQPGEYSSYAPVSDTIGTTAYRDFLAAVAAADDMVGALSLAEALNGGVPDRSSPQWADYEELLAGAVQAEERVIRESGRDREEIMARWRITSP